ncbi:hypothetical protein JI435_419610 [Parastagonospora nodorum SN15]|uniref:Uncharacterized protein n=1 Tax=Phaeosphaeria nodorum (strain SN15 / ATCC MYA-4574 / FGSC 10173) TaxID=321614 RepID=A0A7U2FDW1_PHANO|nr:hypothetical protein JI435_419610 [Parastagonospora nodorum SN15]
MFHDATTQPCISHDSTMLAGILTGQLATGTVLVCVCKFHN